MQTHENQDGNCVWDASRRAHATFSGYRFLYIRRHLAQAGGINIMLARATWKWKRWGWQLREFLFPIITALSCDSQSRLLLREVILWSLLTMSAYWKSEMHRLSRIVEISARYLFIRETDTISLYPRETAATTLYSRSVCDVFFMYSI